MDCSFSNKLFEQDPFDLVQFILKDSDQDGNEDAFLVQC